MLVPTKRDLCDLAEEFLTLVNRAGFKRLGWHAQQIARQLVWEIFGPGADVEISENRGLALAIFQEGAVETTFLWPELQDPTDPSSRRIVGAGPIPL